ncbi:adenosylcobinamide kinase/adenosylcobinamide phosphate guanyltransferase [Leptospira tipperaryensis]|uniref:Adenosylcobinamide kinase n=1 Tax=Leptospira tipperaryensis TaxID=2564040 RepID=A0A1D7V3X2_9LEPT|nr:bifunctional adenosylcobinamide kinase/adenosylcobinamide-phosphate guanylyltransferase [Leptospira tipperaryensis]AOP36539.1 adenosylcobinamide kinase/adenosylcobinamide phosphate guanyltransferase [Leptospira tipperaryensis]
MAGITLITGGCRSGKSRFALTHAASFTGNKYFLATSPVLDEEMEERILKHKKERNESEWETLEEETDLSGCFQNSAFLSSSVVVIDCLSLWVNNLLYQAEKEKRMISELEIENRCKQLLLSIRTSSVGKVIFVTNEVGLGLVPETKLGRIYRDLLGICNQTIASDSETVFFLVSGIPLLIREKSTNKGIC